LPDARGPAFDRKATLDTAPHDEPAAPDQLAADLAGIGAIVRGTQGPAAAA